MHMKKIHLLVAAAIALPTGIFAQEANDSPVSALLPVEEAAEAKQAAESLVRETANPDAVPLENTPEAEKVRDTSPLANPEATRVEDITDTKANPDARPVENTPEATPVRDTQPLANPESREVMDTGKTANPDAKPLEENTDTTAVLDKADTANPESTPLQKITESVPLKDTREMANPEAEPVTDSSEQANTEATPVVRPPANARMETETQTASPKEEAEPAPTRDAPVANTEGEARAPMRAQANGRDPQEARTKPVSEDEAQNQARPTPPRPEPTEATAEVLADRNTADRAATAEQARQIKNDDDAGTLIKSILGGAAAGAIAGRIASSDRNRDRNDDHRYRRGERLPLEEVGRTQRDRDQSVDYFVRRFRGNAEVREAPHYHDQHKHRSRPPVYYQGNRRVVRYASREEIPPVLIGYDRLQRVELAPASRFGYDAPNRDRVEINQAPVAYRNDNAYAVSYKVDPNSAVSRDDILFRQGQTAFADAYSYDLVIDLAEAMRSSALQNERFVIEGHASAEGDYSKNLRLSQDRAERIARDLVSYGVNPDRLVPVGYGEAEANYAADAPESQRRLDRRVMVFRLVD